MTVASPFLASIEETEGKSRIHGFHLGTDEPLARKIVAGLYEGRAKCGLPVVTVALLRGGKIVDVYYGGGQWQSTLCEEI